MTVAMENNRVIEAKIENGFSNKTLLIYIDSSSSSWLNEKSSLKRSHIFLNDSTCPVRTTAYIDTKYSKDDGNFTFVLRGKAFPLVAIQALEISFFVYDVFGERIQKYSCVEVLDMEEKVEIILSTFKTSWGSSLYDCSIFLTSVAFVSKVRTATGKLWEYCDDLIEAKLKDIAM